jgi:competence protein ComEC
MNGLRSVLRTFDVREVWDSGLDTTLPGYREFLAAIAEKRITRRTASPGGPPMIIDGASVEVLHPPGGFRDHEGKAFAAENNRSLVVRIRADGKVLLFTGDIGTAAESELARSVPDLRCDLLKVPHHGSRGSSSDDFVARSKPKIAIVTAGRGNPYGHPSDVTVSRYEKTGSRLYRTDRDGAVMVRIREKGLEVSCWNDLIMNRIDFQDRTDWMKREKQNWNNVGIRSGVF